VSLTVNNEEHLLRALANTGASSSIILEAYTSAPFIKTDDNNTTNWITMGGKFKTRENLHVEEQHQFKILLQKYEHLFDGTLGEFNMEPISLQRMDPNCKPIHACAYTVPRSVEQQLQQSMEIVRLVDIGVLEQDYSRLPGS
jgi:hypothetical protein